MDTAFTGEARFSSNKKYSILKVHGKTAGNATAKAATNMARKKKIERFSVTKAVKANARDRVGQPKPEKIIRSEPQEALRGRKHKQTLGDLLAEPERE
jgi:DNA-directed RNA polymerase alpha subunit